MALGFVIAIVASMVIGALLANAYNGRRSWALVHDEKGNYRFAPAKVTKRGLVADGVTYPISTARLVYGGNWSLYMFKFDSADWEIHTSLDSVRDSMALGSIFKPGGDVFEIARIGATIFSFVLILMLYFSYAGLQQAMTNNAAATQALGQQMARLVPPAPTSTPEGE